MATARPYAGDSSATPQHGARTAHQIAGELRSRISRGEYPPGQLLPTQRQLVMEYGVPRHTMRLAMRELQTEGWIESRQGSGTRVVHTRRIHDPEAQTSHPGPVGLDALASESREAVAIALDALCLTAEPLIDHVGGQSDMVARGEAGTRSSHQPRPAHPAAADDSADARRYERWAIMVEFHTRRLREKRAARRAGL